MKTAFTPSSWSAQSRVTLCRVTWDSSYKDVVSFADQEARDNYFASLKNDSLILDDYSYLNSEISVIVGLILSMLFSGLSILAAYDFSKLSNKKIKEKFNKSMIDTVNAINFTTLFSIILLVLLVLIKVKFCYKLIICYFCVPINYIKLFLSIIVLYMFFIILINIFFIVKNLYQIVISKINYSNNIND